MNEIYNRCVEEVDAGQWDANNSGMRPFGCQDFSAMNCSEVSSECIGYDWSVPDDQWTAVYVLFRNK